MNKQSEGGEVLDFMAARQGKSDKETQKQIPNLTEDFFINYIYEEYFKDNHKLLRQFNSYLLSLNEELLIKISKILLPSIGLRAKSEISKREFEEGQSLSDGELSTVLNWMLKKIRKSRDEVVLAYKKGMLYDIQTMIREEKSKREDIVDGEDASNEDTSTKIVAISDRKKKDKVND